MATTEITTLIVDDEANSRENLQMLLREFCPSVRVIGEAGCLPSAKDLILEKEPMLVFLDIHLGNETVFTLLTELKEIKFAIIFVTADEDHALRAFEFMAIDYLVKPAQIPALVKAVNNAIARISAKDVMTPVEDIMEHLKGFNRTQHKIALATSRGHELVYINEIMYCQADGSYTKFTFKSGEELVVSRNLKYYEKMLTNYDFVRCHNSTLINLHYVKILERKGGGAVIMEDEAELPISRTKRQELDALIKEKRRLI